jgi:hypothetical protein
MRGMRIRGVRIEASLGYLKRVPTNNPREFPTMQQIIRVRTENK